jgi:hypothetical protein
MEWKLCNGIYKAVKITPIFAWYDFWVGFYFNNDFDRIRNSLYFFPVPCFGLRISWPRKTCDD